MPTTDIIHTLSVALEQNVLKDNATEGLPFIRLPHPRTGKQQGYMTSLIRRLIGGFRHSFSVLAFKRDVVLSERHNPRSTGHRSARFEVLVYR